MVFPQTVPHTQDSSSIRSHLEEITQHFDSIWRADGLWMELNPEDHVFLMANPHDVPSCFEVGGFNPCRNPRVHENEGVVQRKGVR